MKIETNINNEVKRTDEEIIKEISLTVSQIDKMKHMIGYEKSNCKKYYAYRNYFCTYAKERELDYLVFWGLAKVNVTRDYHNYSLTKLGIKILSLILGVEIYEN